MRWFRTHLRPLAVVGLVTTVISADGQRAAPARQPASRAAAILTWSSKKRELYIAALDSMFLTRRVKASSQPHVLERGRALASFETGAQRPYLDDFMALQGVRGLLVLQDGRVRLERYAPPYGPKTRWNYIQSLDDHVTTYINALRGSAYEEVTLRQLLTMTSGVKWNEDTPTRTQTLRECMRGPPIPVWT